MDTAIMTTTTVYDSKTFDPTIRHYEEGKEPLYKEDSVVGSRQEPETLEVVVNVPQIQLDTLRKLPIDLKEARQLMVDLQGLLQNNRDTVATRDTRLFRVLAGFLYDTIPEDLSVEQTAGINAARSEPIRS
jgi:hypothetical protein